MPPVSRWKYTSTPLIVTMVNNGLTLCRDFVEQIKRQLDRIEARREDTSSPSVQTVPLPGGIEQGRRRHTEVRHDAQRRGLRLLLP